MSEHTSTETHHGRAGDAAHTPPASAIVGLFSEVIPRIGARLVSKPFQLGRGAECDLTLDDKKVSRAHARLVPDGDALRVIDLGSHNGTYLNGLRVEQRGARATHGDVLRVGRSLFLVITNGRSFIEFNPRGSRDLVGGPTMEAAWRTLEAIAPEPGPVLLEGESGTGKEHCGALLHNMSGRPGPLVKVNSAALPAALAESELFGHVAGAFSGSQKRRGGLFLEANRGTLFLDEVGELPLELQPKLLRVLEEGSLRPVGADRAHEVDVRVVAATNRNLDVMLEEGQFRLDLLHRLAAHRVRLPPLRERREDIPALVLRAMGTEPLVVEALAMERWLLEDWPGNVRQLNNEVARLALQARHQGHSAISGEMLPAEAHAPRPAAPKVSAPERTRLITALELYRGNVAKVARELGVQRTKLYDLMNRHGIDPREYRRG